MEKAGPSLTVLDKAVKYIQSLASGDLKKSLNEWRYSKLESWLESKQVLHLGDLLFIGELMLHKPKNIGLMTTL